MVAEILAGVNEESPPFVISHKNFPHRFSMHICQSEFAALETEGESFVVDAQSVQDCGIQVMNMNRVLDNVVAEVIGLSVTDARLDAAAS